jgi:hypothetical protein
VLDVSTEVVGGPVCTRRIRMSKKKTTSWWNFCELLNWVYACSTWPDYTRQIHGSLSVSIALLRSNWK